MPPPRSPGIERARRPPLSRPFDLGGLSSHQLRQPYQRPQRGQNDGDYPHRHQARSNMPSDRERGNSSNPFDDYYQMMEDEMFSANDTGPGAASTGVGSSSNADYMIQLPPPNVASSSSATAAGLNNRAMSSQQPAGRANFFIDDPFSEASYTDENVFEEAKSIRHDPFADRLYTEIKPEHTTDRNGILEKAEARPSTSFQCGAPPRTSWMPTESIEAGLSKLDEGKALFSEDPWEQKAEAQRKWSESQAEKEFTGAGAGPFPSYTLSDEPTPNDFLSWYPSGDASLHYPAADPEETHHAIHNLNLSIITKRSPLLGAAFEETRSGPRLYLEPLDSLTAWPFLRFLYTGTYARGDPQSDFYEDVPSSVLLHAKLYRLASLYDLPDLRTQAYVNVIRQCEFGCSSPQVPIEFCEAVRFVYGGCDADFDSDGSGDNGNGADFKHASGFQQSSSSVRRRREAERTAMVEMMERVREALINYCVACFQSHKLEENAEFRALMFQLRPFHQDLCRETMRRGFENETAAAIIKMPFKPYKPADYMSREDGSYLARVFASHNDDPIGHFHATDALDIEENAKALSSPKKRKRPVLFNVVGAKQEASSSKSAQESNNASGKNGDFSLPFRPVSSATITGSGAAAPPARLSFDLGVKDEALLKLPEASSATTSGSSPKKDTRQATAAAEDKHDIHIRKRRASAGPSNNNGATATGMACGLVGVPSPVPVVADSDYEFVPTPGCVETLSEAEAEAEAEEPASDTEWDIHPLGGEEEADISDHHDEGEWEVTSPGEKVSATATAAASSSTSSPSAPPPSPSAASKDVVDLPVRLKSAGNAGKSRRRGGSEASDSDEWTLV